MSAQFRPAATWAVLVLAASPSCFEPPKSEGESGGESVGPSPDSSTTDLETAEPADTASRPADDTAGNPSGTIYPPWTRVPPDPDWQPGDDVPGWEDLDCGEEDAPNVLTWNGLVALDGGTGTSYRDDRLEHPFGSLFLSLEDCTSWECQDRVDRQAPYLLMTAQSWTGSDRRLLGWYSSGDLGHPAAVVASFVLGTFITYRNQDKNARAEICVGRVRPDNLRGLVRIVTRVNTVPGPYDQIVFRIPFDSVLPDHAGSVIDPDFSGATPQILYVSPLDYITSWPWEEITDPAIRSALFWRYLPYDWPFPVEEP